MSLALPLQSQEKSEYKIEYNEGKILTDQNCTSLFTFSGHSGPITALNISTPIGKPKKDFEISPLEGYH